MKINILVFGKISDITKKTSWEISGVINTDELKEKLLHDFPSLLINSYAIALNKEIIQKNTLLKDNDTVALLPPYSGG